MCIPTCVDVSTAINAIESLPKLSYLMANPKSSRFWKAFEDSAPVLVRVSDFDIGLWENQSPRYSILVTLSRGKSKDGWTVMRSFEDFCKLTFAS